MQTGRLDLAAKRPLEPSAVRLWNILFFSIQWLQRISRGNHEEAQTQLGHQGQHKSLGSTRWRSAGTHTHTKFKSKVKFFFLVDGGRLRKKNVLFTEVIHLGRPHVTGRIWPGADTRHNFPERPALSGDADRVVRREPRRNGGNLVSVAPLFFEAKSDGFLGRKREKRIRCHQPWSVVARWLVQVMNGRLQRWRHLTVLIFLSFSLSVALVDFQTRKCVPLSCGPVGGHFEFETRCRETRLAGDGTRRGP